MINEGELYDYLELIVWILLSSMKRSIKLECTDIIDGVEVFNLRSDTGVVHKLGLILWARSDAANLYICNQTTETEMSCTYHLDMCIYVHIIDFFLKLIPISL